MAKVLWYTVLVLVLTVLAMAAAWGMDCVCTAGCGCPDCDCLSPRLILTPPQQGLERTIIDLPEYRGLPVRWSIAPPDPVPHLGTEPGTILVIPSGGIWRPSGH